MDRYWLQHYPANVPHDINPNEYASLRELIDKGCLEHADKPAYSNMGTTLTFRELDARSRAFGAWLQREAGLKKGDRIALMMPNILQYPIALFGALRAGLTVVNTNPLYTARELEHQLKDSGARAIVVFENAAHVLEEVIAETAVETVIVTGVGDLLSFPKSAIVNFVLRYVRKAVKPFQLPGAVRFAEVLQQGKWVDLEAVSLEHADVAFLQYTGGTTGVSKGAILTHRNMVSNLLQTHAWLSQYEMPAQSPVVLCALPLYHIYALTSCALAWLVTGGHNVLITNPRDMPGFLKELKAYRFNVMYGVNTLYNGLLHRSGRNSLVACSVRAGASRKPHRWPPSCRRTCRSMAPLACRFPARKFPSAMTTATNCRQVGMARFACVARKSWPATGTARTKPRR